MIGGLVADKRYRFTGAGHCLVEKAEEWARKKGCSVLCVRSNIIQRESHPFYKKLGFKRVKTQNVYLKEL